ncbi:hypothetical protein Tco_0570429 [Tanacetum coccineum]
MVLRLVAAEEGDTHEPLTYQEAVACEDSSKWKVAMEEEMDSLRKNKTWELVYPSAEAKASILEQLDVKTTFLHGNLKEVIYMRRPQGYEQDDMLIACKSKTEIGSTKSLLKKEFDMKELGEAKKILDNGKSVQMLLGGFSRLSLKDCPVRDCDVERMSKVPYANAVRSLMYLMVCTRPDIAYAVSVVSRYLANPGKNHWEVVKWILKYLRGTANVGLVYGNHVDITSFVDSNYSKDPDKGGVYGPYGGCEGSYLAKETLGRRTKHINVRYHFIREVLEAKTVKVLKVGTKHNAADALTKMVPGRKLAWIC